MPEGSPAWKPQATFAVSTRASSASSLPKEWMPNDSPMSELTVTRALTAAASRPPREGGGEGAPGPPQLRRRGGHHRAAGAGGDEPPPGHGAHPGGVAARGQH